ncbi:MAG: iron chaperone [Thiobacillus sp.]
MTVFDDRLSELESSQRVALERIRKIVYEIVPDVEEVITYGMPGFKYKGKYLIAFAAFKDHLSLFPTSKPIEDFKDRLSEYKLSKGTIQFTVDKPIPDDLVRQIVLSRLESINK